jgi:hypothetical protein
VIQALVAEPPVEALNVAVLHRPARLYMQRRDPFFDAPSQEMATGEFRSVVAANHFRFSPLANDPDVLQTTERPNFVFIRRPYSQGFQGSRQDSEI